MAFICLVSESESALGSKSIRESRGKFALQSFTSLQSYRQHRQGQAALVFLDIETICIHDAADLIRRVPTIALTQSFDPKKMSQLIELGFVEIIHPNSLDEQLIADLLREFSKGVSSNQTPNMIVGGSMQAVFARLQKLLKSQVQSIHIYGETGTGKELVAELVRHLEPDKPLVTVNCASLSRTLLESELFGHSRGAFTGATGDKRGFIEAAHNGWLFLDEVNSLSLEAQGCLLRVIENKEFFRLGERTPRRVNFKLLTASNQNTDLLVEEKFMRADFQQRIQDALIKLTPLRERPDEIPALVRHFIKSFYLETPVANETIEILKSYSFKRGNVRELRSFIRAATEHGIGQLLTPRSLPAEFWQNLKIESQILRASPEASREISERVFRKSNYDIQIMKPVLRRRQSELQHFWYRLLEFIQFKILPLSVKIIGDHFGLSESSISRRLRDIVYFQIAPLNEVVKIVRLRLTEDLNQRTLIN